MAEDEYPDRPKKQRYGLKPRKDKEASCPFCGKVLERPRNVERTRTSGFRGGACECGAVFLLDENGNHGGEAIVEVMTAGCGSWEKAWALTPDVDYRQTVASYDIRAHRISEPGDAYEPAAKLYFFRINSR